MQSDWINNLVKLTKKNSPAILSAVAVGGVIATAVLAVKATPKALKRLEDDKEAGNPDITRMEVVRATWTYYIPTGLSAAVTATCIIGANRISSRNSAALLAAYTLADRTLREYKEHVLDEIGDVKERKIREKISEDKIAESPPENSSVIYTGGGDQLCFDTLSGQYFRSDIESIRRAANDFNQRILLDDMYASQNDWYNLVGLEPVAQGDIVGWNVETKLELAFSSHLTPGSIPCLAIEYRALPIRDYEN